MKHTKEGGINFMDVESGDAKVEALIGIWTVNDKGGLVKDTEFGFEFKSNFKTSIQQQERKLQLSNDSKLIFLVI